MSKKQERARQIAVRAISIICEDDSIALMWRGSDEQFKKSVIDKISVFASQQIEEYAGTLPYEPRKKIILQMPDEISSSELYLKNKTTGDLVCVELRKKTNAPESPSEPPM